MRYHNEPNFDVSTWDEEAFYCLKLEVGIDFLDVAPNRTLKSNLQL